MSRRGKGVRVTASAKVSDDEQQILDILLRHVPKGTHSRFDHPPDQKGGTCPRRNHRGISASVHS